MATEHVNQISTNQTVTTTAETVIGAITPFNVGNPGGEGVYLAADVFVLTGVGTTAVTLRIRIGSVTGTILGNPQAIPQAASVEVQLGIAAQDPNGIAGSNTTYVLTYQATAASANATVQQSTFTAESAAAFE